MQISIPFERIVGACLLLLIGAAMLSLNVAGYDPAREGFDAELRRLYETNLFYSDAVTDYETLVREKDLVLGYRLHGNLMALANRVPSIYFVYDSRTAEFCETFAIPCYDVYGDKDFVLEEFWEQSRFERFNRIYAMRYRDMRNFLEENGISHRMRPMATYRRQAPVTSERSAA